MGKRGKLARSQPRVAFAALRDMPGTQVLFWVVVECPYCAGQHLHVAGNPRRSDPGESLGEYSAPCDPSRRYQLTLPVRERPRRKRRRGWEDEDG